MQKVELREKMLAWFQAVYRKPPKIIRVNDLDSEIIFCQGECDKAVCYHLYCLILVLKALATAIRQDSAIKGLVCNSKEFKLAQYADDPVFFLRNPEVSYKALLKKLSLFNKIAGYKINDAKSELMPINISVQDRQRLSYLSQARWKERDTRYLGNTFSTCVEEMIFDNVVNLLLSREGPRG